MKKHIRSSEFSPKDPSLSRRDFIKVASVLAGSATLAACAPQLTATSAPAESTVNSPPTSTPSSTETPSPSFPPEIQEKFKDSKVFRLDESGKVFIKSQNEDEEKEVKGILFNKEGNGTITYGVNENEKNKYFKDKTFGIDVKTLTVDDETGRIYFKEKVKKVKEGEVAMDWIFDVSLMELLPENTPDVTNTDRFHFKEIEYICSAQYMSQLRRQYAEGLTAQINPDSAPLETINLGNFHRGAYPTSNVTDYAQSLEFTTTEEDQAIMAKNKAKPATIVAIHKSEIGPDGVKIPVVVTTFAWKDKSSVIKFINMYNFLPPNSGTSAYATDFALYHDKRIPLGFIFLNPAENTKGIDGAKKSASNFYTNDDEQTAFADYYYKNREFFSLGKELLVEWKEHGTINNSNGIPLTYGTAQSIADYRELFTKQLKCNTYLRVKD